MSNPFSRINRAVPVVVIVTAIICFGASTASAQFVSLPTSLDANELLMSRLPRHTNDLGADIRAGGMASGNTNVVSLQQYRGQEKVPTLFDGPSAYAEVQATGWMSMTGGNWWFGSGKGFRESYDGNTDAGQFWLDSHHSGRHASSYAPSATNIHVMASWYGVGRIIPFHFGGIRGTGNVSYRRITADDYLTRSAVGQIDGSTFTGMLKTVSSGTSESAVMGDGWALDVRTRFSIGKRWEGQWSAEGIMGQISWKGLSVEDSYIVSPRAFEDPDGILHDYGGISGTKWQQDLTLKINPYHRLDMVYSGQPDVLFGVAYQCGTNTLPYCGLAWHQSKPWIPYFRIYPTQNKLELGIISRMLQIRVSSDNYTSLDPKHAELSIAAVPLRF